MSNNDSLASLSVLVVGSGSIATRHARVLRSLGVRSVANYSRSGRELRSEDMRVYHLPNLQKSSSRYDLAVICSATQNHVDDLIELEDKASKILVEKPVSGSLVDLTRLNREFMNPNVYVSFPLRFTKSFWRFRSAILDMAAPPTSVYAESRSWLPDWRPSRNHLRGYWNLDGSGGVLLELIHEFDYVNDIFGPMRGLTIDDSSTGILGLRVPESIDALSNGTNDATISIHLDFCSRESSRFALVSGESETVRWDLIENSVTHTTGSMGKKVARLDDHQRDSWFRRQYEELFQPGSHPSELATLDGAIGLTENILRAWEES